LLADAMPPGGALDRRVVRVIAWMRGRLQSPIALGEAAAQAHLSASRFRHLFVAQTGISFRAYLLWARVESAIGTAIAGESWTAAAQSAGFADSAHLSRTCRRMFGIAPAMLVKDEATGSGATDRGRKRALAIAKSPRSPKTGRVKARAFRS
jgi:AraC-like DNA-binding protein